jgi:hypothetical protein
MTCATFLRALIVTSLFVVVGVPAEPPQARKEATVWALPDSKLYLSGSSPTSGSSSIGAHPFVP